MTASAARRASAPRMPAERGARPGLLGSARPCRLLWLFAVSRRIPVAVALIVVIAAAFRGVMFGHWDSYGALQLPLVFESAVAAVVAVTTASPIGEPERTAGRWLPYLRLVFPLALTAFAVAALAIAVGTGALLAGGDLGLLRNIVGSAGLGLLCAAALGGGLAWTGPTVYLVVGMYAIYTQWHGPALTTPWLWPGRPSHDAGAMICACLVFLAGLALITARGARDRADG